MGFIEQVPDDVQGGHKDGETDYTGLELLLNHPVLARAYLSFSAWLLQDNELIARDRELAILRVGYLGRSDYEWAQHVLVAQNENVADEDIRRIPEGPEAPGWNERDRILLTAVDELVGSAFLSDDTWEELSRYYGTHELMEIMFTVGNYYLMAMVYNTMGVPMNHNLRAVLERYPLPA